MQFRKTQLIFFITLLWCAMFFGNVHTLEAQIGTESVSNGLGNIDGSEGALKLLLDEAEGYLDNDIKKAELTLSAVYGKLNKESDPELWIRYYLAKSIYHRIEGELLKGREASDSALEVVDHHEDSILYKSKIYNALGALADDDSQVELAISYHLKALRYAEAVNDKRQIATVCNGIGRAYLYLSEYDAAKTYYLRAAKILVGIGRYDSHLGTSYLNLSNVYDAEGDYQNSLKYIDKSIELKIAHKDYIQLISSYNNKAYTLLLMDRLEEATPTIKKAMKLADSMKVETEQMYCYSTYAEILFAQNKVEKAEEYMLRSIEMSKKNNDLYLAKYNLSLMYSIYEQRGDYKKALGFYKERSTVMDSVYRVKSRKEVEKLALEYKTEKKNQEIEVLNAKQDLNEINLKRSRQLQYAFFIAALLSIIVIVLLWSRHKNKVKTDRLIKEALEKDFNSKLSETELQALRAQMNPHFLFNCLNSINSFIIKNEQEKASEYLTKFSMLIRKVLNNSKSSKVTLSDELEALSLYVEMESLRFNEAFSYKIDVDKNVEVDYLEIPPLLIQPYVENSIWHGLMHKKEGNGELTVSLVQEDQTLICTIKDNGIGRVASQKLRSKEGIKRKSFGMNITKERLEHINEKSQHQSNIRIIDLEDASGFSLGTEVIIKIAI